MPAIRRRRGAAARCSAFAAALLASASDLPAQERAADSPVRRAIARGLGYLGANQVGDGSWLSGGERGGSYAVAMTGLAGMALVGSGSTPTRGHHWQQVRRACDFLLAHADADTGLLATPDSDGKPMFGHGFATLFLASIYGMEEDVHRQDQLHGVLTRAVRLTVRAQSGTGGWYYTPDSGQDEGSVTVTQMQALRACRMVGIVVDKRAIDRAVEYLRRCQNPDGGISYMLARRGTSQPAISAAAIAVLYSAGVYDDQVVVDRLLAYTKAHISPTTDTTGHHYYTQLYYAEALYQRGGVDWDDYFARAAAWLVREQRPDGSWQGDGVGPVYGTAIALTILQLPDALVPIYQR